ncbi:MAG: NUDIX domain-containing protein, partial [Phycisphaerales bacterium]
MTESQPVFDSRPSVGAHEPPRSAAVDVSVLALWRLSAAGEVEILVGRRPKEAIRGGTWELPGGKIEPGESAVSAALREAWEEVGIGVHDLAGTCEPLAVAEHTDPSLTRERTVRLHACIARVKPSAAPAAHGTAEVRWVTPSEFSTLEFPPANASINEAILARLHAGDGARGAAGRLAVSVQAVFVAAAFLACARPAKAEEFRLDLDGVGDSVEQGSDPAHDDALPAFGAAETSVASLTGSVAFDFDETELAILNAGVDWFVADRVSFGVFGEGYLVSQDPDDALGAGAGARVRGHLVA